MHRVLQFVLVSWVSILLPQDPLPDPEIFMASVRAKLKSDEYLLSQYTFRETETIRTLGKKGQIQKEERKTYEVFPGETPYRRLISENGKNLPEPKIEKQDRKHQKRVQEAAKNAAERRTRLKEKEQEQLDEIFRLFRFELRGRERISGHQTIVVNFEPRIDYKPARKDIRPLKKIRGKAWISEADHQLVKLEAELIEGISVGLGMLAKLHKGAELSFLRRKINDEIWLPAEASVRAKGRLMLLKGFRLEVEQQFSNYQKFEVESSVTFSKPPS